MVGPPSGNAGITGGGYEFLQEPIFTDTSNCLSLVSLIFPGVSLCFPQAVNFIVEMRTRNKHAFK
jgi:hypothetical protein